ncbi:hypothetical protein, partial [Pseudomonas sp. 18173]|uniref:hypothetical protein n=1 Tax=Pseudomonas sp. 18173 TaxID=3390055 RepID=UPI003D2292A2
TGLSVAAHSFTAKALYGSEQSSAARTLTVTQRIITENFDNVTDVKFSPGDVRRVGIMRAYFESGTGNIYRTMGVTGIPHTYPPGPVQGKRLYIQNANQGNSISPFSFMLNLDSRSIFQRVDFAYIFTINFTQSGSVRAEFYNSQGGLLGGINLNPVHFLHQQVSFTASNIAEIRISGTLGNTLSVDDFKFYL